MKQDAHVIVQADNLVADRFSPLVYDIATALSDVLRLEGEILVNWSDNQENRSEFTHCLVFKA